MKKLIPRRLTGTTQKLRSLEIGKPITLDPAKHGSQKNMHLLASRAGVRIATRTFPKDHPKAGKLEVFRLK